MGIYPTLDELKISTHALAWRATKAKQWWGDNHGYFYPRPRMEGDIEIFSNYEIGLNFYPRPRMEGDSCFCCSRVIPCKFLPTPSHGGRRDYLEYITQTSGISTHALAWRATTTIVRAGGGAQKISTHALAWRATFFYAPGNRPGEFLPTPSHGGRLMARAVTGSA